MTHEEVKFSLHNFFDGLLDDFTKHNIEVHLRTCDQCFNEYTRLKIFFEKLKELPYSVEPPQEMIGTISAELMKQSIKDSGGEVDKPKINARKIKKEQVIQKKKLKHASGAVKKSMMSRRINTAGYHHSFINRSKVGLSVIIIAFVLLVIILGGYYIYDFQKYNSPWEVRTIKGTVLINGSINRFDRISEGESLFTESNSIALITVPKVGSVTIDSSTVVFLEKTKDDNNRIKLKHGTIRIANNNYLPSFSVGLSNCVVIDRGGEFLITADDTGNAKIIVKYGFVEIQHQDENIFLDENHICNIKNGNIIGTPYRSEASDELKNEIRIFDEENGGNNSVDKIILLAKREDALTLLALIPHASEFKRQVLFQAVANYFPPPEGVTRMGIIREEPQMLFLWWQEIEWQL